jgi:hypothetical protein
VRALALVLLVIGVSACKEYKPTLDPSGLQSGKKHCTQSSDCGGAQYCGSDGYCH